MFVLVVAFYLSIKKLLWRQCNNAQDISYWCTKSNPITNQMSRSSRKDRSDRTSRTISSVFLKFWGFDVLNLTKREKRVRRQGMRRNSSETNLATRIREHCFTDFVTRQELQMPALSFYSANLVVFTDIIRWSLFDLNCIFLLSSPISHCDFTVPFMADSQQKTGTFWVWIEMP